MILSTMIELCTLTILKCVYDVVLSWKWTLFLQQRRTNGVQKANTLVGLLGFCLRCRTVKKAIEQNHEPLCCPGVQRLFTHMGFRNLNTKSTFQMWYQFMVIGDSDSYTCTHKVLLVLYVQRCIPSCL